MIFGENSSVLVSDHGLSGIWSLKLESYLGNGSSSSRWLFGHCGVIEINLFSPIYQIWVASSGILLIFRFILLRRRFLILVGLVLKASD